MSDTTSQPPGGPFPQQPTTFVGRTTELTRLDEAMSASRLVTVTGPGGVGKTRLALRAAADAEAAFPSGVCLVELSALRDPELLANAVSSELGLGEHDSRGQLEQVLDYLRERRLLLILDTCEHLAEACALFAEAVLAGTLHVTILATSRQPLLADGEHDFQLPPLGADGDAVDLFVQRAAAAEPGFEVTDANREDIARLCARLDGVPLAIELAAGRLREESLSELAKRLDERFLDEAGVRDGDAGREGAAGRDGAAGRHRTLRDAIGWSYDLCTPEERALWERLSVFAGPVGADAARQVCAGPGLRGEAIMPGTFGLVDQSVLTRTDAGDGVSRYGMLDTIREYGAERLAASGNQPRLRAAHLRRYLGLAEDLAAHPLENQITRYAALRAEHADIRAALEHACTVETDAGTGHPALRLSAGLEWYWMFSARFQEARYWLTRGLDRFPDGPDRVGGLSVRCMVTIYAGHAQPALADAEEGLALAEGIGDQRLRARALAARGWALLCDGRHEEAKGTMEEAGTLAGPGAREGAALILLDLGVAYAELLSGDPAASIRRCEEALHLIPADSGERWLSSFLCLTAGLGLTMAGQTDAGNKAILRSIVLKQEISDIWGISNSLTATALAASIQRRPERTAWLLGATEAQWEKFGSPFMGAAMMKVFMDQAAQEARTALGDDHYDEVTRDARSRPLDEVIDMAVRDLDGMPALPSAER